MTSLSDIARGGERLPTFSAPRPAVFVSACRAEDRIVALSGDAAGLLGFEAAAWLEPGFLSGRVLREDRTALGHVGAWQPGTLECRLVRRDGSRVWVERVLRSRGDDPNLVEGALVDIDDRVMREIGYARTVATMRDALLSTSQEVVQPVSAISDFGALLERHLATQSDHVGSDYALGIRDGVERLRALSARLVSASRQGGGR